jgi:hypothetical protein
MLSLKYTIFNYDKKTKTFSLDLRNNDPYYATKIIAVGDPFCIVGKEHTVVFQHMGSVSAWAGPSEINEYECRYEGKLKNKKFLANIKIYYRPD